MNKDALFPRRAQLGPARAEFFPRRARKEAVPRSVGRAAFALLAACTATAVAGPTPLGSSTVTVSYPTDADTATFSGARDYRGVYFPDATPLGSAPNIKVFSAVNVYGRRVNVSIQYPNVLADNESVVAHSFLKIDNYADYFPGIPADGVVTIHVAGIHFNEPVVLDESTFLFHTFWDTNQSDRLHHYYDHPHNLHTLTGSFRNTKEFYLAHEFVDDPAPHHVLGDLAPYVTITGQGTDTLDILAEIPYSMFKHLHEEGQTVPAGLPAPHGFLEPYHFHLEYVVRSVPKPATLLLLLVSAAMTARRRRRSPSPRGRGQGWALGITSPAESRPPDLTER